MWMRYLLSAYPLTRGPIIYFKKCLFVPYVCSVRKIIYLMGEHLVKIDSGLLRWQGQTLIDGIF